MSEDSPEAAEDFTVNRSWLNRIRHNHPRLEAAISTFLADPMSGNTLRRLFGRESNRPGSGNSASDQGRVSMPPPKLWQKQSGIVISQYTTYDASRLPTYWNTTIPDIAEQYSSIVRYEHHDISQANQPTSFNIATIGREIQRQVGDEAFWNWFNTLMVNGADDAEEAVELTNTLGDIKLDTAAIETAIEERHYTSQFEDDRNTLIGQMSGDGRATIFNRIERGEPLFVILVNGTPVQPSFDSIVGAIEDVRISNTE